MKNLLAALTFGLSAAAALGCGPYFPESYLAFETPRTGDFDLACHIKALAEHFHPDMPIVPKPAKNVSTAEGTRLDFLAGAGAAGLPEPGRTAGADGPEPRAPAGPVYHSFGAPSSICPAAGPVFPEKSAVPLVKPAPGCYTGPQ